MLSKYFSQKVWNKNFKAALEYLRKIGTPIARTVVDVVESKEVNVFSYGEMSQEEYRKNQEEYFKDTNKPLPDEFPPTRRAVTKLGENSVAYIRNNNIYISDTTRDVRKFAKALVHEVCHHCYGDSTRAASYPLVTFYEEFRARLAEKRALLEKPLTRAGYMKVAKRVTRDVNYKIPDSLPMPDFDLLETPSKKITSPKIK